MALTDQPYLPFYVNQWLGNIKLKMCSAAAHGVMINCMAIMHKTEEYGYILLKQNFKLTDNQTLNFATLLARILPFTVEEICLALAELVDQNVLYIVDDMLICRRMIKDAELSSKRANSGSKGGTKTMAKLNNFDKAKNKATTAANTVNVIVNDIINNIDIEDIQPREENFPKPSEMLELIKDSSFYADSLLHFNGGEDKREELFTRFWMQQEDTYRRTELDITSIAKHFNHWLGKVIKTLQTYDKHNNGAKGVHPDYWSEKYYNTLDGPSLSSYYSHLNSLGLKVVKNSAGKIIDFQKPQA